MASCEMHGGRRAPSPALGLFLDTCQRCLYLGLGYLVIWLCWLVPLALRIAGPTPPEDPAYELAQSALAVLSLSAIVSFAAVAGAFSWLYDRRAAQLYGMIPLRRGAIFLAAALAGMVPLLVAVGVSGFVFAATLGFGQGAAAVLPWVVRHALLILAFGGLSALCVQLAGRPVYALLCYLLANAYAFAARQFAETLYSIVAPSVMWASVEELDWASPFARLAQLSASWSSTHPFPDRSLDAALVQAVAVYAIMGLACAALAALVFSRRNLERAGDPFVSPAVRTAVNVLVSLLVGFAVAGLVLATSLSNRYGVSSQLASMLHGVSPQLACVLPVVFSVLVFAVAEVIMGHGVKALRGRIPALAATAAVSLVASIACVGSAADAAAFVPKPEDVRSATVSAVSMPFEDEGGVDRVCRLHGTLAGLASAGGEPVTTATYTMVIAYQMKDGTSVMRQYLLPLNGDDLPAADSEMARTVEDFVRDPATTEALRAQIDAVLLDASSPRVTVGYQEYAPYSQEDAAWHTEAVPSGDYAALREALGQDIDENGATCVVPMFQSRVGAYDAAGTYQYHTSMRSILGTASETPYLAAVSLLPTATPDDSSADTTIYLSDGATPHTVAWLRSRYGYEFVER
ncbi:hypothetical protein [Tractidigestivibacter sp.]|uniref:hypothetical protein n=1 Tax=Tractidigestivibacter sp. TaxID=2847320 RepID=UPI002A918118|nr:hypothetical protein [Tractidigestivibacter sp.]MDY5270697.1 hypothetical protein [Tractidigestivibacter sp.]